MTSEKVRELRAAAINLESDDQDYWFAVDKLPAAAKHAKLLARAILELFPEDGEEIPTKEWAESELAISESCGYVFTYSDHGCLIQNASIVCVFNRIVTTRRQFRQLAEALGIQPKKEPPHAN